MKCNPSKYAVYDSGKKVLTFGFRCAPHQVETQRFSTREIRDERLEQHRQKVKK